MENKEKLNEEALEQVTGGAEGSGDFNLEIEDKEFIIFVGPEGCGKSK